MFSAYELYADSKSDERTATEVGSQEPMSMAERFKKAFSHKDVRVHFVGAWYVIFSLPYSVNYQVLGTPFRPLVLPVENECYHGQLMG